MKTISVTERDHQFIINALREKAAADRALVRQVGVLATQRLNDTIARQADDMESLAERLESAP